MIIGVGSDLIDIRRVEHMLERFGERFIRRVFTEVERQRSDRRANRAASYARRFAAKEAGAARRLQEVTPPGLNAQIDVSITDDYPLAHVIVIISAMPAKQT